LVTLASPLNDSPPSRPRDPAPLEAQACAGRVHLLQQHAAVREDRQRGLGRGPRAQQAGDNAASGPARALQVGFDVVAALGEAGFDRAADPLQAIALDGQAAQLGVAGDFPGLGIAGETAAELGRSAQGVAHQLGGRWSGKVDVHALDRAAGLRIDVAPRGDVQVLGVQHPAHGPAVGLGLPPGHAEARFRPQTLGEGRQQVRSREHDVARGDRAGLIPPSAGQQGGEGAGAHYGMEVALAQGSARLGVDDEGLVRRVAQRSGDRPALGLERFSVQLQAAGTADAEVRVQIVARPIAAERPDLARLGPDPLDVGFTAQAPAAVFLAEALQQFDVGVEAVDVDGQRHGPGRLDLGLQLGSPDQLHLVGGDQGGVEASVDQGPVTPVDPDLTRVQPYALGVGDGDPVQGEVVEQVALQAIDVDPPVAPKLLAVDEAGHQVAPSRRQHPIAAAQADDQHQHQQGRGDDQQELRRAQSDSGPGGRRGGLVAQAASLG
jgi:hypothetical protein